MTFGDAAREHAETAVFLKNEFLNTANWRRETAIDYPNDKRNLDAVAILERLADTVADVDPPLLAAYTELFDQAAPPLDAERYSELLREIGFDWFPGTATEFVQRVISTFRSGRIYFRS